ncbi:MAG: choice-of-anchor B family protein [Ignavibacteriales bacterium]|nr:MAG: choice-of-anchor B family protein [Ignavibacteriales bacterium]
MNRIIYVLFLICFSATIWSQQSSNVDLLSNLNEYPTIGYNDIWGYVDSQGREYALLGTEHGTSIIEVTDPYNPVERAFIPGPFSGWRDIKTHSTYAYTITEGTGAGQGLQIIDLSNLPASATLVNTVDTWFSRAHNIFIDNGFAYVIGTNNGGGMHILDLSNPTNPVETDYYTASGYIHDVYVWNDTVIACAEDSYHLINVSNKANPAVVSQSLFLPNCYAHSGWMTEDKRYFIGTEEFDERDITVWDLQDRTSWTLTVPTFETASNTPVHNLFVKGDFAHVSYYKDGYVVLDISDPTNPSIAGYYDTYASSSGTYRGAWGCYPYLPSGAVIVSDMQTGLYVFDFLGDGTVPVELTSFAAQVTSAGVNLNWSTASEVNNYGFEIERKYQNESSWKVVGLVAGSGTTTQSKEYSYSDKSLSQPGKYYYRLKQIDNDGTFSYSDEIEVDFIQPDDFVLNQNYPNPFNPSTTIEFSIGQASFVKLEVYSALGEKVADLLNENKEQGSYKINFDSHSLPSGIYIAKLDAGSKIQTIKMSLVK